MKYILLIDEDEDILDIQKMVLSSFYGGKVIAVKNGKEAISEIKQSGEPELIVSDHKMLEESKPTLYSYIEEHDLLLPLIICSGSLSYELKEREYPLVAAFVQKPFSIESLSYLVKSITTENLIKPDYIPVKLPVLLNFIGKSFDLYLKLSDTNFVKLIKQGEVFTREDSEKLTFKGITHLYVSQSDSLEFLRGYEENLNLLLTSRGTSIEEKMVLTIDAFESIERISKRLGWTPEVIEAARKSIDTAVKIISKDSSISLILKKKFSNPSHQYSRHVGLLSYLSCILSEGLGWGGESVKTKLALAAILHDLAVEESYYDDIKIWNKKASNMRDRTPETIKYRLHPIEASKLIHSMHTLPPDVDQILLQHHEKKDGTGFPRGLSNGRISQLATFFIIVEDLVEFIGDGENLETSLIDFKTWGDAYYDVGHFKKIYQHIREKVN